MKKPKTEFGRKVSIFLAETGMTTKELAEEADVKYTTLRDASCVLVLAGVYSTYSKWINIELELASELGKKIIAIEPWGGRENFCCC